MKEFDFDELDKAVNSLMGDVNKSTTSPTPVPEPSSAVSTEPATQSPQSTVPPVNPAAPPTPVSLSSKPVASTQTEASAASTPLSSSLAPVASRPSGRFMDVVHPSSDMKTPSSVVVPSREGISLQPLTPTDMPANPKVMNDVIAPAPKPAAPSMPAADIKPAESNAATSGNAEPAITQALSEPWSSPFLPDTQVEKRPLGGTTGPADTGLSDAIAAELAKEHPEPSSTAVPKEDAVVTEPDTTPVDVEPATQASTNPAAEASGEEYAESNKPNLDLQLAPQFDEKTVPAELDNDLVAIESGKASVAGETSEPVAAPDMTPSTAASTVLTTSSIPQQYDETPSSGDASHTPIYDNEAVHQSLNHPAKKKKGWVLIVLIVGIILLGGALGGAAYYFGLI